MDEKQTIERSTIDGFLLLYNGRMNTHYRVIRYADIGQVPDAECRNSAGQELNIEVTMTEDRPRDIQALLGRSDHKSIEALTRQQELVKKGLKRPQFSSLQGNVLEQLADCITAKLKKRYGSYTALVVRDTSPLSWNWDKVKEPLIVRLKLLENPFDKGIWILGYDKAKLYELFTGTA